MAKKKIDSKKSGWGGRREGAGAKPRKRIRGGSHTGRAPFTSRQPIYIGMLADEGLPSMRERKALVAAHLALGRGSDRFGFRIVHYLIEKNHLHMVVEAKDRDSLGRAMKGLGIRMAKALNREWGRKGVVFGERYRSQVLKTKAEVRGILDGLRAAKKTRVDRLASSEAWSSDELGLREIAREEGIGPAAPKTRLLIDAGK